MSFDRNESALRDVSVRSTIAALRLDLDAYREGGRIAAVLYPQVLATATYRVARLARSNRWPILGTFVSAMGQFLTGAEVSPMADLAPGLVFHHTAGVVVGSGVRSDGRLHLYSGVTLGALQSGPRTGFPSFGDDAVIYTKASVLGDVTVGAGALIAAHALVLSDVPPRGVAIGVPARVTQKQL